MENFKSFGGKMSIPLMEGYMAITGPNGSGKSNITDAILFVLGPKSSKAMRAGKLTDLIYNGNKSSGKADYTKVTLFFDNTDRLLPWDADEVRFTRVVKVSSDGEGYSSNFYINDQRSSMAEFDSILTSARISADGYNMVQQGDVTDITKMGNVERRRVLDSISGVSSYDADIAKAENEKAETEANMRLTEVILGELEEQIAKLEKDMESAKKYVEAKERLDMANAQYSKRQLLNKEEELKYTQENCAKMQAEIDALAKDRERYIAEVAELKVKIAAKEKEIGDRIGPEYADIKKKIEDAKIKKALSEDKIGRADDDKKESESELEIKREEFKDAEAELNDCLKTISDTDYELGTVTKDLQAATAERERINNEFLSKGGELKQLQNKSAEFDAQIDGKSAEEKDAVSESASAEAESESCSRGIADLEGKLADIDFEIKDSEWGLSKVKEEAGPAADYAKLGNEILELKRQEKELERQEQDLNSAARRIGDEYNRLAAEKKVSDQMRGSDAVMAVLEMRDKGLLRGIHGTVAELATVDKEFETALSVAAGGKMQAIIVDNDEVAAQAIAELKKKGHGRATFLPLNKMMEGKPRAKAIMVVKETLGYAIDLIDFKPEYKAAFWYVFADTLVVDSIDTGRRLMGGIRIVTKEGELLEASGAMTGGTLKKTGMKFGTASESKLDEVSARLRDANDALDRVKSKLIELRGKIHATDDRMRAAGEGSVKLQGEIAKYEARLKELRGNKTGYKSQLEEKKAQYAAANQRKAAAAANIAKISEQLTVLKQEREKIRQRIAEVAPADLQEKMKAASDAADALTVRKNELTDRLAALNAEKSGYEEQRRYAEKEINRLLASIESDEKSIEEENKVLDTIKVELDALRKIESEMEAGIEDLRNEKDALTEAKYKAEGNREKAISDIETKEGIKASQQASLITIQQAVDELRAAVAEIKVTVEEPIPSEETLKRTIRACQNTIDSLGNVNLRAIDDYNERKQRYDTVNGQINELNERIKDLDKLTERLSKERKGLFMEVYNGVNANFKTIFAELSGGGEAYMELEDEDDPFNGGLLINAKPKNGKKLRLDALSGGEKSLTALAFIFAIQEHQPSPFYVLDEVDMFLDSVNSEMVAQRIKKSSMKTQFIQVSLRKVTLSLADHLIGVTRPPNGVSRVIMNPNLAEVSKYEEENARKVAEQKNKDGVQ